MARPRGQQRAVSARAAQGQAGREMGAGMVGERLRRAGCREEGSLREAGGHACDPEADNACHTILAIITIICPYQDSFRSTIFVAEY